MIEGYQFPRIHRDDFKPIYVQVADMLIDYATKNNLKPGDPLPSENQLLSLLQVSRNSIRLAMDRLVKMDFAVKKRGQGTYIKPQEHFVNLDFNQGFEGSLYKLGIETTNILIEKTPVTKPSDWMDGLTPIKDDNIYLVRRVKKIQDEIIALEDRILPLHIIKRYTKEELEKENLNPNLLERYSDTTTKKFKYYFSANPLVQDEANALNLDQGAVLLQRVGEYFNCAGECIMHGRHIFSSTKINVSYEFERGEHNWHLT